jgi:hypothetical protein
MNADISIMKEKICVTCANCGYVHEVPKSKRVKKRICDVCERGFNVYPDGKTETIPTVRIQACFIATAAYGTPFEEDIDVLRDFRDDVLAEHHFGRMFIDVYYVISPRISEMISRSEVLRMITRGVLKPIVFVIRHDRNRG